MLSVEVREMLLPQIRMESQMAKIAISTTPGKQSIKQPKADIDLQPAKVAMEINRTPGKLTIDQTKAWEDRNLADTFRFIEKIAEEGYQAWLEGIARLAEQGDELMKIENGGSPLADQAKENSESPMYEVNVGWIPSLFSVKFDYEPGNLDINWHLKKAEFRAIPNKPIIHYDRGRVDIKIAQYQKLKIDFANLTFKGQNFEMNI